MGEIIKVIDKNKYILKNVKMSVEFNNYRIANTGTSYLQNIVISFKIIKEFKFN